ncbi:hypothetical protein B296_00034829 [Ensete ventricosum]|uniref:Uncharacterized protein n=1 Tax=Ensete ventricosum TaxID=4639 RepID=A0A427A783_ENSVE|nr:hypothetical protein B296_00034829 [Ensete ventricosum]
MEGPSSATEAADLRPPIVGRPSGSPGVEVVSLSSMNSKVLKALMRGLLVIRGRSQRWKPRSPRLSPHHEGAVRSGWSGGKDRYFVAQIFKLSRLEAEDLLKPRWPNLVTSFGVWTDGPLVAEYVRGALHPSLTKQLYKATSEELMDRAAKPGNCAATERQATELSAEVEQLKATLGESE